MTSLAPVLPCATSIASGPAIDQRVLDRVQEVFQQQWYRSTGSDRRCDRREPFPYPVYVTPIAEDGTPCTADTIVVLGKHLSERGLDFYYEAPLPYRRVIASWECCDGRWLALLLDLRWCRSTRHGWYENGGRFLQAVESPLGSPSREPPGHPPETS